VLCHEEGRTRIRGYGEYATPDLNEAIELHLTLARRTNSRVRCAGVSLNTSKLSLDAARVALSELAARLSLPVADPIRRGEAFEQLVTACLANAPSAPHVRRDTVV
jgi:uncharacterized NAD-dependent epimerase/dehydratase family protein